jgi:hypothetical protein
VRGVEFVFSMFVYVHCTMYIVQDTQCSPNYMVHCACILLPCLTITSPLSTPESTPAHLSLATLCQSRPEPYAESTTAPSQGLWIWPLYSNICIYTPAPEPEFVNVTGAQESTPRNRFCQLIGLAGRYDNTIPTRFLASKDCSKIPVPEGRR